MDPISTPFRWQDFGGDLMLVTDHSGARVVLAPMGHPGYRRALVTRDERGVLVPLTPEMPAAKFILHACNMHGLLESVLQVLLCAVDKAGADGQLVGGATPLAIAADRARAVLVLNNKGNSAHTIVALVKVQFRISGMPEDEHETAEPKLEITYMFRPNEGPDVVLVAAKVLDGDGLGPTKTQADEWAEEWLSSEGFDAACAKAIEERGKA